MSDIPIPKLSADLPEAGRIGYVVGYQDGYRAGQRATRGTAAAKLGSARSAAKSEASRANGAMRKSALDWQSVDWSLSTLAIAARLGCHPSLVRRKRRELAG